MESILSLKPLTLNLMKLRIRIGVISFNPSGDCLRFHTAVGCTLVQAFCTPCVNVVIVVVLVGGLPPLLGLLLLVDVDEEGFLSLVSWCVALVGLLWDLLLVACSKLLLDV